MFDSSARATCTVSPCTLCRLLVGAKTPAREHPVRTRDWLCSAHPRMGEQRSPHPQPRRVCVGSRHPHQTPNATISRVALLKFQGAGAGRTTSRSGLRERGNEHLLGQREIRCVPAGEPTSALARRPPPLLVVRRACCYLLFSVFNLSMFSSCKVDFGTGHLRKT